MECLFRTDIQSGERRIGLGFLQHNNIDPTVGVRFRF
jgi:hypothetical protein